MARKLYHIVFEDNHLLIVNKDAGILVQSDSTGDKPLLDWLKEYVKEKYNKPGDVYLVPVHRLDRPVSGLVIFAKTSKAAERMSELFRKRSIQKTYWAIVRNKPDPDKGRLTHWLIKDEQKNLTQAYDKELPRAQRAELTYRVIGELNKYFLLEVNPLTGRPHQIRVQLAKIGSSIRGDAKYGFPKFNPDNNINLHARRLFFIHPIKKEPILCRAGVPRDPFWEEFLELDDEVIKDEKLTYLHE